MSESLVNFETRLRRADLLDDAVVPFAIGSIPLRAIAMALAKTYADDLGLGREWVDWFPVSNSGSSDFTIDTSAANVNLIVELRRESDGRPVGMISNARMEQYRVGTTTPAGSRVESVTLIEKPDQDIVARCWPRPTAADTIQAELEVFPVDGAFADGTLLPFSDVAIAALAWEAAIDCALAMDRVDRENRNLSDERLDRWRGLSQVAKDKAKARIQNQRRQPRGLGVMRW